MRAKVSVLWPSNKWASFEIEPGLQTMALVGLGLEGHSFGVSDWFDGYSYSYFWGDFSYHIYARREGYSVTDTHRNSRDLIAEFTSTSLEFAEKWLLVRVGSIFRSLTRLPEIELPRMLPQLKVGYNIVEIGAGLFTLSSGGGKCLPFELSDWGERPVNCVKYSHIVDLPLPGLIESYKSGTGAPFLQGYVVTPDGA